MTKCPVCKRPNSGFIYENSKGEYRFSECGHLIPIEPKPVFKTMREIAKEAGVLKNFH